MSSNLTPSSSNAVKQGKAIAATIRAIPIAPAPDARDEALRLAKEALAGVIRVADRNTTEFDAARAALAAIDALEE